MLAREPAIVGSSAHRDPTLGGEDNLIAATLEPIADNGFGTADGLQITAHWITIGGIEEVHPMLGCRVHNRDAGWLVALLSKCHRAETDFRYLEASTAHSLGFHFSPLALS